VSDFGITPEIRDPFAHRRPPADDLALGIFGRGEDFELCRIVEGGLDSQDVEMIVEFDRVASDTELDPATFGPLLAVDHDLASKGVMGFFTKKAHDVGGTEAGDGGMDEVLVDPFEIGSGLEQDIGGHFCLVHAKPVAVELRRGDGRQERIDAGHLANQERRPVGVVELLGKCRGGFEIRHPENLVVAPLEGDTHLRQLPTQPLPAIDVNLSGVRRPGLDTHVHPAKNRVDQIPVQVQAAAIAPDDFQTFEHGHQS
jgi:hypothetical protein